MSKKNILITGAGGFIGQNLAEYLRKESSDNYIVGVDVRLPSYLSLDKSTVHVHYADNTIETDFNKRGNDYSYEFDEFHHANLTSEFSVQSIFKYIQQTTTSGVFDEVYTLAADMGGAGYIFTGNHDADIMTNSALINLHIAKYASFYDVGRLFYSSSACMYPEHNQLDSNNPNCEESSAYPAAPDSEYGWEKLFSERVYLAYAKNYNLNAKIARYHNVYGKYSEWDGGREKSPAAICRKVICAQPNVPIEIWGDGEQTRSFLYIDDCVEATVKLLRSDFNGPVNIGSEEMVTINKLVDIASKFDNKDIQIKHIEGPLGVRGRSSHNKLIKEKLDWEPKWNLTDGLKKLYTWIKQEINKK